MIVSNSRPQRRVAFQDGDLRLEAGAHFDQIGLRRQMAAFCVQLFFKVMFPFYPD